MNKTILKILSIVLCFSIFATGCDVSANRLEKKEVSDELKDIVYEDADMAEGEYTVMIKEQGEYVPYLVITDNYNGSKNCLLLRKYLLDEFRRFDEFAEVCTYYGDCELDAFLNEEYINMYSNEIQNMMIESKVEITAYLGVVSGELLKKSIKRKIFILSYEETCNDKDSSIVKEGEPIKYFEERAHLIATKSNGESAIYWLRTPDPYYESAVCAISDDGLCLVSGISGGRFEYEHGVRPVFCLPRDTKIVEVDGLYYIEADYNSLDVMNNAEDRRDMLYEEVSVPHMAEQAPAVPFDYQPEGYNVYVKPALACEIEAHKDDETFKFHTIIYSGNLADWDAVVFDINNNPDNDIYLDMDYWIPKECEDGQDRYYYVFTADEIKALSEHEIHCAYVGLGTCDMEKANWDTEEGILEYCELYGDGYVKQ